MASQCSEMGGGLTEDGREFRGPNDGGMEKMGEEIQKRTPKKCLILVLIGEWNVTVDSLHLMVLRSYTHQCDEGLYSLMITLI